MGRGGLSPHPHPLCPPPALTPLQAPGPGTLLEGDIVRAVSAGGIFLGGGGTGGGSQWCGGADGCVRPPQDPSRAFAAANPKWPKRRGLVWIPYMLSERFGRRCPGSVGAWGGSELPWGGSELPGGGSEPCPSPPRPKQHPGAGGGAGRLGEAHLCPLRAPRPPAGLRRHRPHGRVSGAGGSEPPWGGGKQGGSTHG